MRHRREPEVEAGLSLAAIGQRIKQLRLEKGGMTQDELAKEVGISVRAVAAWEAGESGPYRYLPKLEKIFGTPSSWILYGDAPPRRGEQDAMMTILMQVQAQLQEVLEELRSQRSPQNTGGTARSRSR